MLQLKKFFVLSCCLFPSSLAVAMEQEPVEIKLTATSRSVQTLQGFFEGKESPQKTPKKGETSYAALKTRPLEISESAVAEEEGTPSVLPELAMIFLRIVAPGIADTEINERAVAAIKAKFISADNHSTNHFIRLGLEKFTMKPDKLEATFTKGSRQSLNKIVQEFQETLPAGSQVTSSLTLSIKLGEGGFQVPVPPDVTALNKKVQEKKKEGGLNISFQLPVDDPSAALGGLELEAIKLAFSAE